MCGRFSNSKELNEFAGLIKFVSRVSFFAPRYNIAPRQQAPVVVMENDRPVLKLMRWGLIPSWAKDESIGDRLINARSETLLEKPSFRKPFREQRCLVLADGFYEWQTTGTGKTPFRFILRENAPFCFAGLWEKWIRPPASGEFIYDDEGDTPQPSRVIETFSIITTSPNKMVAAVHDRMPAILQPQHCDWWIDANHPAEFVGGLLRPYLPEEMECYRVSPLVNSSKNDSPECIKPA